MKNKLIENSLRESPDKKIKEILDLMKKLPKAGGSLKDLFRWTAFPFKIVDLKSFESGERVIPKEVIDRYRIRTHPNDKEVLDKLDKIEKIYKSGVKEEVGEPEIIDDELNHVNNLLGIINTHLNDVENYNFTLNSSNVSQKIKRIRDDLQDIKREINNKTSESELSASQRNNLSNSSFAIPNERKYPIEDINHARNALARVSQFGSEKKKVRAAVYSKYPELRK